MSFGPGQGGQAGSALRSPSLPGLQANSSRASIQAQDATYESTGTNNSSSRERSVIDIERDPNCPQLAKDIVVMERDFIQFLSQIYSI